MRLTQYIEYMNTKEHPDSEESRARYTHLTLTERTKAERRKYRANTAIGALAHDRVMRAVKK